MLGLDAATAKATLSAHTRSVLLHAEARKTVKCVLREMKPAPLMVATTAATPSAAENSAGAAAGGHARPALADKEQQKGKKMRVHK